MWSAGLGRNKHRWKFGPLHHSEYIPDSPKVPRRSAKHPLSCRMLQQSIIHLCLWRIISKAGLVKPVHWRGDNKTYGVAGILPGLEPYWTCLGHTREGDILRPGHHLRWLFFSLKPSSLKSGGNIPQNLLYNLIHSMPHRCAAVLEVRGNHIPY